MSARAYFAGLVSVLLVAGCGGSDDSPGQPVFDAGVGDSATQDGFAPDAPDDGGPLPDGAIPDAACGTATQCAQADEQRAADNMTAAAADPLVLRDFLDAVPKGGDLHMHLSGAVYAETYMEWARAEGGFCITNSSLALSKFCNNTSTTSPVPTPADALFNDVIRAWSMQDFVPGATTGHDHFFSTFGKFGAISGKAYHARGLADVMKRADSENMLYVEPMLHSNSTGGSIGSTVWTGGALNTSDLPAFHAALLAYSGWNAAVQNILSDIQATDSGAQQELGCSGANAHSACRVGARFMVYISRGGSGPQVFAQMVAAFEAAMVEPRLVAVNLVGPEDGNSALSAYDRHMEMLGYLNGAYAGKSPLHVTLHAGEITPKYLPSNYNIASINHIRKAVQIAKAERIGHGIDVLGETDPVGLLTEMRQLGVMVEIGLSSNIQILEVSGTDHPLSAYLQHDVPVALATDDQAVSRSSMTGEYMRAVQDQKLRYATLKKMARTSLEKSFLPGASLWQNLDTLQSVPECAPTATSYYGDQPAPPACPPFLSTSEKAAMQWELEQRFREFESKQ
ncbi:MAG TPA: hypothetical protein PKD61_26610 [Polyangiaceae bacterium]|nr:hypothetical protein [Polyangiaceae bacterium]